MQGFRDLVSGWLGKLMLAILIVPFAIFGIYQYFEGGSTRPVAATVNGKEIYQADLDKTIQKMRGDLLQRMGRNADPAQIDSKKLHKDALDSLINQELMAQQAQKEGYTVSDAMFGKLIKDAPVFQENGQFSPERYQEWLRQNGEDPNTFPTKVKRDISINLFTSGVGTSAFLTGKELGRLESIDKQTRDVHVALVPVTPYVSGVTVNDDEIKKYYDANPGKFTTDERVALDYIELSRDDFVKQVQVSDEDLQASYQAHIKTLAAGEQRHAQHILIKADPGAKDAEAQYAAALAKIQDIEKRVKAGEDFSKLAKQYSQDPGSVAIGGDLGFAPHGQFVPEFDKALFALQPGEVSAPVKTQYGYHLIKLLEIQKPQIPSFADMKPQLAQQAATAKADALYNDQIDKIDTAVYEAADLKDPSAQFKLPVQSTEAFTKAKPAGIAATNRNVLATAFSDELIKDGKNSPKIALDDAHTVWVRAKSHEAQRLRPLAEVAGEVKGLLTLQKAGEKAKAQADAIAAQINGGKSLADVAASNSLKWQDLPNADHRAPQFPSPDAAKLAFRLPAPAAGKLSAGSVELSGNYAVVAVSKVTPGSSALAGAELSQLTSVMGSSRGQQEVQDYVEYLKQKATIKTFETKSSDADSGQ